MEIIPSLTSERLVLRPFTLEDAKVVQELAGDERIAATTLTIPHPYLDGMAEEWITAIQTSYENGNGIIWAVTIKETGKIAGAIGLQLKPVFNKAEIGYWIGVPFWNKGYASEATATVIKYGFEELMLNKMDAHYFATNPASGRVMVKNGMQQEGLLRKDIKKDGEYIDIVLYGILRDEYLEQQKAIQE